MPKIVQIVKKLQANKVYKLETVALALAYLPKQTIIFILSAVGINPGSSN